MALAACTTSPFAPKPATLTNALIDSPLRCISTQPKSLGRVIPVAATHRASPTDLGTFRLFCRSLLCQTGTVKMVRLEQGFPSCTRPLTTSWQVPSPPTAATMLICLPALLLASICPCPGASVTRTSHCANARSTARLSWSNSRPARPAPAFGLTTRQIDLSDCGSRYRGLF